MAFKSPITLEPAQGGPEDDEDVFSPSMFMERQTELGRSVGLVIDLCANEGGNTRLYEPSEWDDWDVKYEVIPCSPPILAEPAHNHSESGMEAPLWAESPPSEELCQRFISTCSTFWQQERNRKRYIAVHCVTGVNVTGYMIVRYLMQRGPLPRALDLFAAHRPPGIYSVDFLEALWKCSGMPLPQPQQWRPPPPPAWHPLRQRVIGKPAVPLFTPLAFEAQPVAQRESIGDPPVHPQKRPRSDAGCSPAGATASEPSGLAVVAEALDVVEAARLCRLCEVSGALL